MPGLSGMRTSSLPRRPAQREVVERFAATGAAPAMASTVLRDELEHLIPSGWGLLGEGTIVVIASQPILTSTPIPTRCAGAFDGGRRAPTR